MTHLVTGAPGNRPRYSLVIPIFNEEAVLPLLIRRIKALLDQLDGPSEAIFVDDGSRDTSAIYLREMAATDPRIRLIELSRNFGHQIAITAGMDAAAGDAVIVMDADLQDPPEVALDLIAKWKEGYEIVYARRIRREGETLFKRLTAKLFYRVLDSLTSVSIPRDVGDFRLIGRKALTTFKSMPERDRFVRGMFGWMGFKQTRGHVRAGGTGGRRKQIPVLEDDAPGRAWHRQLFRKAAAGSIMGRHGDLRSSPRCSASSRCLHGCSTSGVVQGWTSTVVIISFLSGINLFMTGVIGLYVGGIHAEVKRRPLYVVDRLTGFEEAIKARSGKSRRSGLRPAGATGGSADGRIVRPVSHQLQPRRSTTSISFSGLKHDFFLQAKVEPLAELIASAGLPAMTARFGRSIVGCGVGTLHPHVKPLFSALVRLRHIDGIDRAGARGKPGGRLHRLFRPSLPYADGTLRPRIRGLRRPPRAAASIGRVSLPRCGVSCGRAARSPSSSTTRSIR